MNFAEFFKQDPEIIKQKLSKEIIHSLSKVARTIENYIPDNLEIIKCVLSNKDFCKKVFKSDYFFSNVLSNFNFETAKYIFDFVKDNYPNVLSMKGGMEYTVFHNICKNRNFELFKYIFDQIINICPEMSKEMKYYSFFDFLIVNTNFEIVKYGFETTEVFFPEIISDVSYDTFSVIFSNKNIECVKFLLSKIKNPKLEIRKNKLNPSVVYFLSQNPSLDVVKYGFDFLKQNHPHLLSDYEEEETIFHSLDYNENIECVRYILENIIDEEFFFENKITGYAFIETLINFTSKFKKIKYIYEYVENTFFEVLVQDEAEDENILECLKDNYDLESVKFFLEKINTKYREVLFTKNNLIDDLESENVEVKSYILSELKK